MTIVDQRRTSDLAHFDESCQIDTSFRVGLDLMKLFEVQFAWASTSTYRFSVDFFHHPAAGALDRIRALLP